MKKHAGVIPDPVTDELKVASCEIIKGILAKAIYNGNQTLKREKVKADEVESEEEYQEVFKNLGHGVVCGSYNQYEVQTLGVLVTDKQATLLQNEVTAEPLIGDEWMITEGKFKAIHKGQDSAQLIWKVQLRNL